MDLIITILSLLTLLVFTKLGVNIRYRKLTHDQLHAVEQIQHLNKLISRLQQYRCDLLTNTTEQYRTKDLSRQINQQKENLHDDLAFQNNERWLGFLDHWSRLREVTSPDNTGQSKILQQFDAIISNLIQLVEELADSENLDKEHLVNFPNINLMWREFPLIIENAHKLILLNHSDNHQYSDENEGKKMIILLKLILQLSRTGLHHVRYNGEPSPRKEVLLNLTVSYGQLLQGDLETGKIHTLSHSPEFKQAFSKHLVDFVQAFQRLQVWELDMLKAHVNASQGNYVSA